eukprot:8480571-Alexandrium_andersonii.AAC.1
MEGIHNSDGVVDADSPLLSKATSWDYSSAFDRVDPAIACSVWEDIGVPPRVAGGLRRLWSGVVRVLEISGE